MTEELVFIYGTLKQGFPNHHLNHGVRVAGDFVTVRKYPFYLIGDRHSPWLINNPDTGEQVCGEVYRVDQQTLAELDRLERLDQADGYRRERIDVMDPGTNRMFSVYAYMQSPQRLADEAVKAGPLDGYGPDHARLYRSRRG